jgi:hypothetical protein
MTTTDIVKAVAIAFALLPAVGAQFEGGIFCGITTTKDGVHAAVVLLADKPAGELDWQAAKAWAAEVGGELPTRPVAALLFANAKDQFEEEWHWTSEEFGASCAWYCYVFGGGSQSYDHKSYEGCARAVRLIPLVA